MVHVPPAFRNAVGSRVGFEICTAVATFCAATLSFGRT
jgi:hypothetical protein